MNLKRHGPVFESGLRKRDWEVGERSGDERQESPCDSGRFSDWTRCSKSFSGLVLLGQRVDSVVAEESVLSHLR